MGYRKREMLKKFQHDTDIPKVFDFDYGLWGQSSGLTSLDDFTYAIHTPSTERNDYECGAGRHKKPKNHPEIQAQPNRCRDASADS